METVKREVSWLERFPPDLWAYFVCYLSGEHIGRLMMTGATFLWQQLKSPKVVKSINLGSDFISFKSWPRFLNDFPSLEELSITISTTDWSFITYLRLDSIPSGLKKLELDGILDGESDSIGLFGKYGTPLKLSEHQPHLETFSLNLDIWDHSWMAHSPQSLTRLSLASWDGTVQLPSSLIHFKCDEIRLFIKMGSRVSPLPTSLVSFEVKWSTTGVESLVPLLPPTLRNLSFGEHADDSNDSRSSQNLLELLPKSITCLKVPVYHEFKFETNPTFISMLPTSLTELYILPHLPCSAWHLLPPNLKMLVTAPVFDREADQKVQSLPIDTLPRSITRLELLAGAPYFCGPSSGSNPSYFPPSLTQLQIPMIQLSPEIAKLLPISLTYLVIGNLCERVCEHLATGLKTLKASRTLMSPNLIKFLPKSLTVLVLQMLKDYSRWYDYNTGEIIDPTSMQEYSVHQKCLSNSFDWKDLRFPPTLTHLDISQATEIGDSIMLHQKLPNLVELMLSKATNFTDISIPLLPRHLTTLGLMYSSHITGSSFRFLPRGLLHLNLSSSESIFDADIQHLPRTLKEAQLSNAIHLTDLCIPDLPPHLEVLNLERNSLISTSSFPYLPHTLRSRRLYRPFELANMHLSEGEAYPN